MHGKVRMKKRKILYAWGLVDVHVPRGIHDPELSLVCLQQCDWICPHMWKMMELTCAAPGRVCFLCLDNVFYPI